MKRPLVVMNAKTGKYALEDDEVEERPEEDVEVQEERGEDEVLVELDTLYSSWIKFLGRMKVGRKGECIRRWPPLEPFSAMVAVRSQSQTREVVEFRSGVRLRSWVQERASKVSVEESSCIPPVATILEGEGRHVLERSSRDTALENTKVPRPCTVPAAQAAAACHL